MKLSLHLFLYVIVALSVVTQSPAEGRRLPQADGNKISRVFIHKEVNAKDFLGSRSRRSLKSLQEECCHEVCSKEEVCEVVEDPSSCTNVYNQYDPLNPSNSELCHEARTSDVYEATEQDDDGETKGDPHYTTFDGLRYSFQGVCSYILFTDGCMKMAASFSVESTTEAGTVKGKSISRVSAATIRLNIGKPNETVVELGRDDLLLVNGREVTSFPHVMFDDATVQRLGSDQTVIQVERLLTVMWDGKTHVQAQLKDNLRGKVCGMLGNADGYPNNDLRMPDGQITSNISEFADSWKSPGSNC